NFNVAAPSTGTATVTYPTNQQLTIDTLTGCPEASISQFLVFGNITGPVPPCSGTYIGQLGISFFSSIGNISPGNLFFVQLIAGDNVYYPNLTCTAVPGLDGAYLYQSKYASSVNDAPFAPLLYNSITRDFFATMYLMWQAGTAPFIPVPI